MATFDPNHPQNGDEIEADLLRNNFNALNEKIDAIPSGPAGPEGRHVVNVRDNGDGRAVVEMSDGSSYGPFWVSSGPPGSNGSNGADGRSITQVRDNGDGTLSVDMSDGSTYGPFAMPAGPQGPPGEVSAQQLSDAIAGTSANTNAVEWLAADADLPTVVAKINELLTALRR